MNVISESMSGVGEKIGAAQRAFQDLVFRLNPNYKEGFKSPIEFEWKQWKVIVDYRYFLSAILIFFCVAVTFPLFYSLPGGDLSVVTLIAKLLNSFIHLLSPTASDLYDTLYRALIIIMVLLYKNVASVYGRFDSVLDHMPAYAMREEYFFRRNSEHWTLRQSVMSCFSFALAHLSMLIVPLAALPVLTFAGAMLLIVYRIRFAKTQSQELALEQAATLHTAFNVTVLVAFALYIIGDVISVIFHH